MKEGTKRKAGWSEVKIKDFRQLSLVPAVYCPPVSNFISSSHLALADVPDAAAPGGRHGDHPGGRHGDRPSGGHSSAGSRTLPARDSCCAGRPTAAPAGPGPSRGCHRGRRGRRLHHLGHRLRHRGCRHTAAACRHSERVTSLSRTRSQCWSSAAAWSETETSAGEQLLLRLLALFKNTSVPQNNTIS